MSRLTKLIVLLTFFIFISCSEDSKEDSTVSDVAPGIMLEKDVIISEDVIIQSEEDTITLKISAVEGNTYAISVSEDVSKFNAYIIVLLPDGERIWGYSHTFRAALSGDYTVKISVRSVNNYSGPFSFSYNITEFPPLSSDLQGFWLLTEERISALGKNKVYTYSLNNSSNIMEIRNDTLFDYFDDALKLTQYQLYADSRQSRLSYSVSGNTLTYYGKRGDNTITEIYTKYDGDFDDVVSHKETFTMSNEFIGTWYKAKEHTKWIKYYNDGSQITQNDDDNQFNTAVESDEIITITRDSITHYYNNWGVVSYTSSIENSVWTLRDFSFESGSIVENKLDIYNDKDCWSISSVDVVYKKYTGELPYDEWSVVSIPEGAIPLILNSTYNENARVNDTLWFSFSASAGESYGIDCGTKGDLWVNLGLFNSQKEKVGYSNGSNNSIRHTAVENGTYYIVAEMYEGEDSPLQITVRETF